MGRLIYGAGPPEHGPMDAPAPLGGGQTLGCDFLIVETPPSTSMGRPIFGAGPPERRAGLSEPLLGTQTLGHQHPLGTNTPHPPAIPWGSDVAVGQEAVCGAGWGAAGAEPAEHTACPKHLLQRCCPRSSPTRLLRAPLVGLLREDGHHLWGWGHRRHRPPHCRPPAPHLGTDLIIKHNGDKNAKEEGLQQQHDTVSAVGQQWG